MKKTILSVILIIGYITIYSQEFSFEMIFEDAIGNTDTLIMGYDPEATDSVDSEFGELNIIESPLDSIFDVRITDEWRARSASIDSFGSYHIKKQIVEGTCESVRNAINIDILCKNWPVTARWNNSGFELEYMQGSVLTSVPPGGWWDVVSPSDLWRSELFKVTEVTFTENVLEAFVDLFAYINNNEDTISVFWVVFAHKNFLYPASFEDYFLNETVFYPNPSSDFIFINNPEKIIKVSICDLSGKENKISFVDNIIDIRNFNSGVYILKIITNENIIITKKLIKP